MRAEFGWASYFVIKLHIFHVILWAPGIFFLCYISALIEQLMIEHDFLKVFQRFLLIIELLARKFIYFSCHEKTISKNRIVLQRKNKSTMTNCAMVHTINLKTMPLMIFHFRASTSNSLLFM